MPIQWIRSTALIAFTLFIFFNFKFDINRITDQIKFLDGPDTFPGTPFLFLRPFLSNVFHAGYYSDRTPVNPDLDSTYARNFQTARFALSPVLLDHEKPFDSHYIVLYLLEPKSLGTILKRWPSRVVAAKGHVVFIERIKA